VDEETGEIVISYTKELLSASGNSLGVPGIDVQLTIIGEYVETLRLSEAGYGIFLNRNFEIMAHRNDEYMGKQLGSISGDYAKIQAELPAFGIAFLHNNA